MSRIAESAHACALAVMGGDRAALGRAITWLENDAAGASDLMAAIRAKLGAARVTGFTGAPGVGKSTLVGAYVTELRRKDRRVGVIAVDPSSALSGGAILGDRIRMASHTTDRGVFVRSLAARGHLGGLSLATARIVSLMNAFGMDDVLIETVGTGQSELEVADLADTTVVVCAPGFGDDVQALKAGVLEIADVLVVNKRDLPGADRLMQALGRAQSLAAREPRPAPLACAATQGAGLPELVRAVDASHGNRSSGRLLRSRKLLARAVAAKLEERLRRPEERDVAALCRQIDAGAISVEQAVDALLDGMPSAGENAERVSRKA